MLHSFFIYNGSYIFHQSVFCQSTKLPKALITPYQTHLMAASGYYNHLLFRLQYEFKLDLHTVTDCYYQRYPSAEGQFSTTGCHT